MTIEIDKLAARLAALEAEIEARAVGAAALIAPWARRAQREAFWDQIEAVPAPLREIQILSVRLRKLLDEDKAARLAGARGRLVPAHWDRTNRRLREARYRLQHWNRVHMMLGKVMSLGVKERARPVPLFRQLPPGLGDDILSRGDVIDRFYIAAQRVFADPDQHPDAAAFGAYKDIPMPLGYFVACMHCALRVAMAMRRPRPLSFLDVGCGSASKVLAAAELFDRADGLEYDANYARRGREVLGRSLARRSRIIEGNALEFDHFGDYDVVFAFKPIDNETKLAQMEARIVSQVSPGTVLVMPYPDFHSRHGRYAVRNISGPVYVAGISEREGRGIAARAPRTGIYIEDPRTSRDPGRLGYLMPLILKCRDLGFDPTF